jgi:hypothetical protein
MNRREPVTDWKNWRDVFASETVVDPGKYKSRTLHVWTRPKYAHHDDPRPMPLSSYASIKGHHPCTSLDVAVTPQAIEAIRSNTIHVDGSQMALEVIVWSDGRALVVANHGSIIGGVWLAVIDAATIPAFPREYRVLSEHKLEAVFTDDGNANAYAEELRGIGATDVIVAHDVIIPEKETR